MSCSEATQTDKTQHTTDHALAVIEQAREKFGPVYLGGSRRMHELAGDGMWDNLLALPPAPDSAEYLCTPSRQDIIDSIVIPISEATDYDFYAKYSHDLYQFLYDNGFTETENTTEEWYDLDDETVTILECDNVQIVLRTDPELYKVVFDNITPEFYKKYLWKSSGLPSVERDQILPIFNMLFAIARSAQKLKD